MATVDMEDLVMAMADMEGMDTAMVVSEGLVMVQVLLGMAMANMGMATVMVIRVS